MHSPGRVALHIALGFVACTPTPAPSADTKSADAKSADTKSADTNSADTKSADAKPDSASPDPASPDPASPDPASPDSAKPDIAPAPVAMPAADGNDSWTFDDAPPGAVAPGFTVRQTGVIVDPPATWSVAADDEAPSGTQGFGVTASVGANKTYNLAWVEGSSYGDFSASVMVRAQGGTITRAGGIIFRGKGDQDHYVARWNPVEANFRVYALLGGARVDIASAPLELDESTWHSIRIVVQGDAIECFVDDRQILRTNDKALPAAGMIGLWTKADATTLFDDLVVQPLPGDMDD